MDDALLARYVFFGIAAGAVAFGIWWFLRRDPPGRDPSDAPSTVGEWR